MLGEQLGTLTGKIVNKRVVNVTDSPQVEFNIFTAGKVRQTEVVELHTYTSEQRS